MSEREHRVASASDEAARRALDVLRLKRGQRMRWVDADSDVTLDAEQLARAVHEIRAGYEGSACDR